MISDQYDKIESSMQMDSERESYDSTSSVNAANLMHKLTQQSNEFYPALETAKRNQKVP